MIRDRRMQFLEKWIERKRKIERERKRRTQKSIWSSYAPAFRKHLERPTFKSDWDMHVLLFFLVSAYLRELNAAARDKTIRASLRNDKLSREEEESGESGVDGIRVEMHRARVHLVVGEEREEVEDHFEAGDCICNAGRRREGRSSTQNRTRNVKPVRDDPNDKFLLQYFCIPSDVKNALFSMAKINRNKIHQKF